MMKRMTGKVNHFLFLFTCLNRFCLGVWGNTGLILIRHSVFTLGPTQAGVIKEERILVT